MNNEQKILGELVRITTKDGLELHSLLFEPKIKTDKVLIHVHGWTGNFYENKFIDFIAKEAISKGFAFLTFNNRGAGMVQEFIKRNKSQVKYKKIGGSLEKFEECLLDISAAVNFIASRGYNKIVLEGHSSGCQKIVFYQYKSKDKKIKGLVLLAPVDDVGFTKRHFARKYKKALAIARKLANKNTQAMVPQWMAFSPMFSAGVFLTVADPNSLSGRIFDYSGRLAEIRSMHLPVLAIFGSEDDYQIDPDEKLGVLRKRLKECDTILIKQGTHGFVGCEKELSVSIGKWLENI